LKKNTRKKEIAFLFLFLLINTYFFIPTSSAIPIECNKTSILKTNCIPQNIDDEQVDQKINLYMKLAHFPSLSTCVINNDSVVWYKGYGYYDIKEKKVPDKDTIYIIASITKTIVGTAFMQLYEQGYFNLDDDVNTILPFSLRNPYFPDDPITFRMLLSHTSSLNTNVQNEYYWFNFSGDPPFSFFPEPFLEEFLVPGGRFYSENVWSNTYRPGQHAMYANIGFDIISYLVELISGESFLSYCQQHIFDPLEMDDTSYNLSTLPINHVAKPYMHLFFKYYQINELPAFLGDTFPDQPYWKMRCFAAGGLYTTINDLSHFLIAHMNHGLYKNNQILKKETVDLMHDIKEDNAIGYGLAWMRYPIDATHMAMGHGGDIMGVDTWMLYVPSENIGVIYFANGNPAYEFGSFFGSIAIQLLLQTLFEKAGLSTNGNMNNISLHTNLLGKYL